MRWSPFGSRRLSTIVVITSYSIHYTKLYDAQREQVRIYTAARDRRFDEAQAEYELELKTDFGDALVGQSESALLAAKSYNFV